MNRVIIGLLLVGLAASATLDTNKNAKAESLLTRYYNVYKELSKVKDFPESISRADLMAGLRAADPATQAAVKAQFMQRSDAQPLTALENAFRSMAEEAGFTEDQLQAVAEEMIADGKFPDLREMNNRA